MKQRYDKLTITSLDKEQHAKTCNYWYVVQHSFGPHTAFTTRRGLERWLEERGLSIDGEKLANNAVHSTVTVNGSYNTQAHSSYDEFYGLKNVLLDTKDLSNGQWTMARITQDSDGTRTVHTLNPNCRFRPVYDYETCREIFK